MYNYMSYFLKTVIKQDINNPSNQTHPVTREEAKSEIPILNKLIIQQARGQHGICTSFKTATNHYSVNPSNTVGNAKQSQALSEPST